MVTLRALPTHTSAVGVSASAKPARVVAGVDMHILYKIPTGPPQMPRVLEFNGSNGTFKSKFERKTNGTSVFPVQFRAGEGIGGSLIAHALRGGSEQTFTSIAKIPTL